MHDISEQVAIEMSADEAVVLFELLSRWEDMEPPGIPLEHPAERRVLWSVLATLERTLVEPFLPDYRERLAQARDRVQNGSE